MGGIGTEELEFVDNEDPPIDSYCKIGLSFHELFGVCGDTDAMTKILPIPIMQKSPMQKLQKINSLRTFSFPVLNDPYIGISEEVDPKLRIQNTKFGRNRSRKTKVMRILEGGDASVC